MVEQTYRSVSTGYDMGEEVAQAPPSHERRPSKPTGQGLGLTDVVTGTVPWMIKEQR